MTYLLLAVPSVTGNRERHGKRAPEAVGQMEGGEGKGDCAAER